MKPIAFLLAGLCWIQGVASAQVPAPTLPILAWYSIPARETNLARYAELKAAGITHQLSFFSNSTEMQQALDVAAKTGIRMVVSCPELKTDPEKTVRRFMDHPAVAGYHLIDEPGMGQYPELAAWAKRLLAVDDRHFLYVNLFPNFCDSVRLGTSNYREYLRECARQLPLQFLSFDFYPVLKDHLMPTWYENLEQFSEESGKAGKPFWAFVLTTNFDNDHLTPQTLAAMRLQAYSNLAYGAQGIQYFTYWSATSLSAPSVEDQRGAPITATGKRTVVYDRVRQLSTELQALAPVFVGARMLWVRHTGSGMIPKGTVRLTQLPEPVKVLDTKGAPALIALLENGGQHYLVVVNKDFLNPIHFTFYGDASVQRVLKDGSRVPAHAYEPAQEIDPGDAVIYCYPVTGH